MQQQRPRFTRRGLLQAAALTAAPAAPQPGSAAVPKRGSRVRTVERPTLGETNADFKRFSGNDAGALYRKLKTERDGEGSFEAERTANEKRAAESMRQGKPGFALRDYQLMRGAWTTKNSAIAGAGLLSWTRIFARTPADLGVDPYVAPPREMASTVKAAAKCYGAALVGIAPMNETYVNMKHGGKDIVFEDSDLPAVTARSFAIPRKMKWVVVIAVQSNLDLIRLAPSVLGEGCTGLGYSQCAFTAASLAEFIRGLGYQAIPSVSEFAQNVPLAIDAGLGELGRMNRLVTPEFGPAVRLGKVFTDMPMACDKPIDFGLVEFCKRCRTCAAACPSRSLSFDEEPGFKTTGPWNNAGHKAWFDDASKCYQYSQKMGANTCSICIAECPYTRAACARADAVDKATASLQPAADGVFRILKAAPGPGKQKNPEAWWNLDSLNPGRRG